MVTRKNLFMGYSNVHGSELVVKPLSTLNKVTIKMTVLTPYGKRVQKGGTACRYSTTSQLGFISNHVSRCRYDDAN